WNLAKAMSSHHRLAQWKEHQTVIWLSRVRLPYRPAGRKPANANSVRVSPRVADDCLVCRAPSNLLRQTGRGDGNTNDAMQCVDTAFTHAAFDDHGSALSRCEHCSRRTVRRNDRTTLRTWLLKQHSASE